MDIFIKLLPYFIIALIVVVLVVEGFCGECISDETASLLSLPPEEHVAKYENDGMGRMDAIKKAAKDRGMTKSELYKILNS